MSLLLLIDGYNVVAPVAAPRRPDPLWLHRERMQLIDRLSAHLPEPVRSRTRVVFDAANPPPDRPSRFEMNRIDVQFAVEYPEADDLLEEIIRHHSTPKRLAVVSSDHRIQTAARKRSAATFDSQPWLDDLLDGKVSLAIDQRALKKLDESGESKAGQGRGVKEKQPDADEVDQWMRDFGF